ncbi:MAG TPA: class I fructose-bisphosphate aldolase [Lacunisphaera sp.]
MKTHPHTLDAIARALVAPGKGILAADESVGTMDKRLEAAGITPAEENRRAYREMLLGTSGLGEFISGVILFDETLRQNDSRGVPLVERLLPAGILAGIKVDRGAKPLAGYPEDKITEGLDGLRERLAEYAKRDVQFAKWRAVFAISPKGPTAAGVRANAHALGRYAALCQEAGLVPIVEPEVLMDGDHSIERHGEVTEAVLQEVFSALHEHRVRLEAILLKPNMVLAGKTSGSQVSSEQVAKATLECLRRTVPAAVPGIVFLSGGQSDIQATENLNALNLLAADAPWRLSFSFGRALQAPALKRWAGDADNVTAAQRALYHRAKCNSAARAGTYSASVEAG